MSSQSASAYVGRFAPSPTGPLHQGSLTCALASFLDARHQRGKWLLRVEDIDPPREQPGASGRILRSLAAHGLRWDGAVSWQSRRFDAHRAAVERLLERGEAFRCDCSRARLAPLGGVYDGRCRERRLPATRASAVRLRVEAGDQVAFDDRIQRRLGQDAAAEIGDFVIWRRDGLPAYQLAVVLDDAEQGVTDILRGADLYSSTPRQIILQRRLGLPTPRYAHVPVLVNSAGRKLGKRTRAPAVDDGRALENLELALRLLGQPATDCPRIDGLLERAASQWRPERIRRAMGIPAGGSARRRARRPPAPSTVPDCAPRRHGRGRWPERRQRGRAATSGPTSARPSPNRARHGNQPRAGNLGR